MVNFDGQALPCEDIDNGQCSELLAIAQFIVGEVEAPSVIRSLGLYAGFAMNEHLAATWPLCSQYQAFLAIKSIYEVTAYIPSFTSEHDVHTPIAIPDECLCDLVRPLQNRHAWIFDAWFVLH